MPDAAETLTVTLTRPVTHRRHLDHPLMTEGGESRPARGAPGEGGFYNVPLMIRPARRRGRSVHDGGHSREIPPI